MTLASLSENTPVTMGLAGGLVVVAFWAGLELGQLRTDVSRHSAAIEQLATTVSKHDSQLAATEARAQHRQ